MTRIIALLSVVLLTACVTEPAPPPAAAAKPAQPAGHVSFSGEMTVRNRTFVNLGDRVQETLKLQNNLTLFYVHANPGVAYPGRYTDAQALKVDVNYPFFRDRRIQYDASKVKTNGVFAYMTLSSDIHNCFLFHHNFGPGGPRGDRQVLGYACWPVTGKDAATLTREMLAVLPRILIDGAPVPAQKIPG